MLHAHFADGTGSELSPPRGKATSLGPKKPSSAPLTERGAHQGMAVGSSPSLNTGVLGLVRSRRLGGPRLAVGEGEGEMRSRWQQLGFRPSPSTARGPGRKISFASWAVKPAGQGCTGVPASRGKGLSARWGP
jgi:hypothetical protein